MNPEFIDVVDDLDHVIGQETITESIRQGFNRRVAHIWIFDVEGKLLVCQRPFTVKSYPGKWTSSAGGYVTTGDSYEITAHRELKEELGLVASLQHAFLLKYSNPRGYFMFIDLWFGKVDNEKIIFDSEEIMGYKFISIMELGKWITKKPEDFNPEFIELVKLWNEKMC